MDVERVVFRGAVEYVTNTVTVTALSIESVHAHAPGKGVLPGRLWRRLYMREYRRGMRRRKGESFT